MGNTPIAESLIGVFVAMALVVTFRRRTHRAVELAVWLGLIWVCVVAVAGTDHPQARALTAATVWGTAQMAGTILDLVRQGVFQATYEARFLLADWVVLLAGVDVLVLALVVTERQAGVRMSATRLRDWRLLPRLRTARPARPATAVDVLNQRFNAWSAPAAAASLMWSTLFFIWLRDVEIPNAVRALKNIAFPAGGTSPRVTTESVPLGPNVVDINVLAARVARKADTGAAPIPTTPDPLTGTNGSKKHRQSRLAS